MSQILLFYLKNWIWNIKCSCQHLPLSPPRVVETQTVIKMWPDCSPMSQEQIETLIFKIWCRMPEIFDQNHDWIVVLPCKEPKESHLFTFYAVQSTGLLFSISRKARWCIALNVQSCRCRHILYIKIRQYLCYYIIALSGALKINNFY